MTLRIAVAPNKFSKGVDKPGYEGFMYDWREPPGDERNTKGVEAAYQVLDLQEAMSATWKTDAHFVTYLLRCNGAPLAVQPRINKPAAAWLRSQGYELSFELLVADVDNPGHATWTPELRDEALRQHERIETAGVYFTTRGRRILQPLTRAVGIERIEAVLRAWLTQLEAVGIKPDWQCVDWTRHFRMPHVRRQGRPYRSEHVAL